MRKTKEKVIFVSPAPNSHLNLLERREIYLRLFSIHKELFRFVFWRSFRSELRRSDGRPIFLFWNLLRQVHRFRRHKFFSVCSTNFFVETLKKKLFQNLQLSAPKINENNGSALLIFESKCTRAQRRIVSLSPYSINQAWIFLDPAFYSKCLTTGNKSE